MCSKEQLLKELKNFKVVAVKRVKKIAGVE